MVLSSKEKGEIIYFVFDYRYEDRRIFYLENIV